VSPESVAKVVKINQEKKPRLRGHWISSMVESAENNNFRERERDLPVTIASRQGEGIINRQGQEESARSKQRMRAKSNKAVSAMSKFKYNITTIAFQHQANQAGYVTPSPFLIRTNWLTAYSIVIVPAVSRLANLPYLRTTRIIYMLKQRILLSMLSWRETPIVVLDNTSAKRVNQQRRI